MPNVPWLDPIYVKLNYFKEYVNNRKLKYLVLPCFYLLNYKIQYKLHYVLKATCIISPFMLTTFKIIYVFIKK